MKAQRTALLLALMLSVFLSMAGPAERGVDSEILAASHEAEHIQVPPPPFSEGIFPCMDCHEDLEPNPQRRPLKDFHEDIVFRHDEENRWCLDCHDKENRNVLRLASGATISFEESYRLCGQCHGPKLRDWKAGVHGKRSGSWSGRKTYLLCAHCHDPHRPRYQPLKPLPAPVQPAERLRSLKEPYVPVKWPTVPSASGEEHVGGRDERAER